MSKTKFLILNCAGGLCAALVVANLVLARMNETAGRALNETQSEINRAQQLNNTAQNLVVRIAQAAQNDPALRELLARQDLKVNFNAEKPTPSSP